MPEIKENDTKINADIRLTSQKLCHSEDESCNSSSGKFRVGECYVLLRRLRKLNDFFSVSKQQSGMSRVRNRR